MNANDARKIADRVDLRATFGLLFIAASLVHCGKEGRDGAKLQAEGRAAAENIGDCRFSSPGFPSTNTFQLVAAPVSLLAKGGSYLIGLRLQNTGKSRRTVVALRDAWGATYGTTTITYPAQDDLIYDNVMVDVAGLPESADGLTWDVAVDEDGQGSVCHLSKRVTSLGQAGVAITEPLFFSHPIDAYNEMYTSYTGDSRAIARMMGSVGKNLGQGGEDYEIYLRNIGINGITDETLELDLRTGTLFHRLAVEGVVREDSRTDPPAACAGTCVYHERIDAMLFCFRFLARGTSFKETDRTSAPELLSVVNYLTALQQSLH